MSQPPRPPQPGEVVNGYQWTGREWVPLPPPPQVGQVVNGHRWDGRQWVPLPPPPQVGQVVNGHQWTGREWVPLPQLGQVVNGHRWDGVQWVPLGPPPTQRPQPGQAPAALPVAAIVPELRRLAEAWQFEWHQRGDTITVSRVVAEQKGFLAAARLEYRARIRVDDAARELRFVEWLKESGAGLSGSDDDPGLTAGFGVQRTSSHTGRDGITEAIEEQAARFAQSYPLDFRFDLVRHQVRGIAEAAGYAFRHGPW